MKKALLLLSLPALICCARDVETPAVSPEFAESLSDYLETKGERPEDYIIGKFKDRDVVLLGESYRIRHNVEFVQKMISELYENGIYNLCTEFARREDQGLIDSLLAGAAWDEELAREIVFRYNPEWGYREYIDVFKEAWRLNSGLDGRERRFRIFGVNDSQDWSLFRKNKDRDDVKLMEKVLRGGGENYWAFVVKSIADQPGEKVMVHCGIDHAFTKYRRPEFDTKGSFLKYEINNMGRNIFLSKKTFVIFLHGPWEPARGYGKRMVHAVDGVIDAMIPRLPKGTLPVGFDTKDTPFGMLTGKSGIYSHGYPYFLLRDFCDGYICLRPLSGFEGTTPVEGFVNEYNIERARKNTSNLGLRNATVEEFGRAIAGAAEIGFRHLK